MQSQTSTKQDISDQSNDLNNNVYIQLENGDAAAWYPHSRNSPISRN